MMLWLKCLRKKRPKLKSRHNRLFIGGGSLSKKAHRLFYLEKLLLHGSYSWDVSHKDSDIDTAVVLKHTGEEYEHQTNCKR